MLGRKLSRELGTLVFFLGLAGVSFAQPTTNTGDSLELMIRPEELKDIVEKIPRKDYKMSRFVGHWKSDELSDKIINIYDFVIKNTDYDRKRFRAAQKCLESGKGCVESEVGFNYLFYSQRGKVLETTEVYQSPLETLEQGKGLCGDLSLLLFNLYLQSGIVPKEDLRLSLSRPRAQFAHFFVEIKYDGEWYILDPSDKRRFLRSEKESRFESLYNTEYFIDGNGEIYWLMPFGSDGRVGSFTVKLYPPLVKDRSD